MNLPANNALVTASQWLADVATGSIAVGAATIAVAGIGFVMLAERVHLRRGATVILGCFILFVAPMLARAFAGWAITDNPDMAQVAPTAALLPAPEPPPYQPNDPYAGASLFR